VTLATLPTACATGGTAGDSTATDGSTDGTTQDVRPDVPCPTGHTGPNCQSCAGGFHTCGTSCEPDHANMPDAGCTHGCNNTACGSPTNGNATCTGDGKCDFACNTSFDKSDGGTCDCPTGQIVCTGVCQQCCTDTDCPNHLACVSGTCSGCQAGWGACGGDPLNCNTQLNSSSHCGSCGNSCCSSFCGCGFLGTGGKSCKPSGTSYSCQC
jgi:hypothetical protein